MVITFDILVIFVHIPWHSSAKFQITNFRNYQHYHVFFYKIERGLLWHQQLNVFARPTYFHHSFSYKSSICAHQLVNLLKIIVSWLHNTQSDLMKHCYQSFRVSCSFSTFLHFLITIILIFPSVSRCVGANVCVCFLCFFLKYSRNTQMVTNRPPTQR